MSGIVLNPIEGIDTVEKLGTRDDVFAHRILGSVAAVPETIINLPNFLMAGAQALPGPFRSDPAARERDYAAARSTLEDVRRNRQVISGALGIPARGEGSSLTQDVTEAILSAGIGITKAPGTVINLATHAPSTSRLGRIAEVMSPVTYPLTPANVALNAGVGAGLTTGIHALSGQGTTQDRPAINPIDPPTPEVNAIESDNLGQMVEQSLDTLDPMRKTPEEKNYETTGYLAGAAALATAAFLAHKYTRAIRDPVVSGGPNVKAPSLDTFSTGEKAATHLVDSNIPMREVISRASTMSPDEKELAFARLDGYTRAAAGSRVEHSLNTGELVATDPSRRVVIPAYAKWKNNFDTLSKDEQDGVNKLLALQDQQDTRALAANAAPGAVVNLATNVPSSAIRPGLSALSDTDIAQQITALQANPKIAGMVQEVRQMTQGALQYLQNEGIITKQDAHNWWSKHPHFLPNMEDPLGGATGWDRQWQAMVQATKQSLGMDHWDDATKTFDSMRKRNLEHEGGIDQMMAATEALPMYLQSIQRMVMENEVRKSVSKILLTDPQFKGIVKKLHPVKDKTKLNDENSFTFAENGKQYHVEVKDPTLARAMRLTPHLPISWWGAVGKLHQELFQAGTTGVLAPWFALTNVLRETQQLGVTKGERSFGLIDRAVKGYFPGDPTAIVHSVVGTADNLFGGLMKASHEALSKWAFKFSDGKVPQPILDNMAAAAQKAYLRTARALMEQHGAFQSMHLTPLFQTDLERLLPKYANSADGATKTVWRIYRDLLSSIHQGARTGFVLANYKKGMSEAEVEKLMASAQRSLGNPNLRGEGLPWGIPYLNPAIQGTRSVVQAFREHPMRAGMGTINGLLMPPLIGVGLMSYLGDDWMNFYNNEIPEYKKSTTNILPHPELILKKMRGEDVPVDPTMLFEVPMVVDVALTPAINAAREGFLATFGLNKDRVTDQGATKNMYDSLRSAFWQGMALPLPLVEAGMIAATSHEITPQGIAPVKPPGPMGLVGAGQQVIGGHDVHASKIVETILGTAGKMMLSAAETGGIEATLEAKDGAPIEKAGAIVSGAGQQLKEDLKKRIPSANVLFNEYTNPRATPLKDELRKDLDAIKAVQEQFNIDFSGGTDAASRRPVTLKPIASPYLTSDPRAEPIIADVALLLRGDPTIRYEKQRLTELYAQRTTLDGAKHEPTKRIELNKVQEEINARDRSILLAVREIEEQIAKKYNLPGFRVRQLLKDRGRVGE